MEIKINNQTCGKNLGREIEEYLLENNIFEITEVTDNGKCGDQLVTVYGFVGNDGYYMVADTNGGAVWQENCILTFNELMESEGICA